MASTFDYKKAQRDADKLLTYFGKQVDAVKTNTTPSNTSQPWDGPTVKENAGTSESVTVRAAFVDPSDAAKLGLSVDAVETMRRYAKMAVVAHPLRRTESLKGFHYLRESASISWKIGLIEELNPAGTPILYFMGVNQ